MMGMALLAGDNPRNVDIPKAVKGLESYVQTRIKRDRDERIKAGVLQESKPPPPPTGQGTRPTVNRREIKNMQDADAEWDSLFERWPDETGPPK